MERFGSAYGRPARMRRIALSISTRLLLPRFVSMMTVLRSSSRRSMNARNPAVLPVCQTRFVP